MQLTDLPGVQAVCPTPDGGVLATTKDRGYFVDAGGVERKVTAQLSAATSFRWIDYHYRPAYDLNVFSARTLRNETWEVTDSAFTTVSRRAVCGGPADVMMHGLDYLLQAFNRSAIVRFQRDLNPSDCNRDRTWDVVACPVCVCPTPKTMMVAVACRRIDRTVYQYTNRHQVFVSVYDYDTNAYGGKFPVFDRDFDLVEITPTSAGLLCSAGLQISRLADRFVLSRWEDDAVEIQIPELMKTTFDIRPGDHLMAGSADESTTRSNVAKLVIGKDRDTQTYMIKGGKLRGARFAADGQSVWFWTTNHLGRIDLE